MINLERLPGWRKRVDDFFDDVDGKPFAWGTNDCATFAAGAVNALTGIDFAEGHREAYNDAESAIAYLAGMGFADYGEYIASLLPEKPVCEASYGDIAVIDVPGVGPALGVFGGTNIQVMTLRGKGSLPLLRATRMFKVGNP